MGKGEVKPLGNDEESNLPEILQRVPVGGRQQIGEKSDPLLMTDDMHPC